MNRNDLINYLKNTNIYTEESLVDGFINDRTIKYLPLYVIEFLSLNKEAQEIIINMSENNLKILSKIISYADNKYDWIVLSANFYHFLKNSNYSNLIKELEMTAIDDEIIEKLLFASNNSRNYFNINSINDLNNLDTIRQTQNDKNNELKDPNILLLNKYGISYDKAYSLYTRYGKDILKLPESKEKEFLLDIKNIIEGKGTEKIIYKDLSFIVNIDSILRNFYSKIYNDCFYKVSDDKKIGSVDGINIYDAGVDFNMRIYSYGLASNIPIPDNYKDDWNRPNISVDYMCNSIINSCNIKTRIKHCVYGFGKFEPNDLALLGANDLGTGGIYEDINITNPFHQKKLIADVEFRVPDELINNTRFTNNEAYCSRRRVNNGKLERINPDYIVYFKTEESFENDSIWVESLNAAKDFNIPIVIINCEKCLNYNIEKIEKELEEFESRYDDTEIIKNIIEKIYTISSGYRDVAPKLLEKYFNQERLFSYINRISQHIDEISTVASKTALECIDIVLDTLDDEFKKILKSPYWVEYARNQGYQVDKPVDIITYFEIKKKELEKENENNNQFKI